MLKAKPTIQVDNERAIVTEWHFPPGAETGFHVHAYAYVVVPMTSGTLRLEDASGRAQDSALQAGLSYARPAGVAHNVVNVNNYSFTFIEIEIK